MIIQRIWSMPDKNTFQIPPIRQLLADEVNSNQVWIDPFANSSKIASITNDLNENYDTDYHMEAIDFLAMFDDRSVDGVLFDPPYSPRQVRECYDSISGYITWDGRVSFWSEYKDQISRILKIGGKAICFGWNSNGVGSSRGFEMSKGLLVPHGGTHNDTIVTVETKVSEVNVSPMSLF